MNSSLYYQILEIGFLYEKGRGGGKIWRIGERKRLREEVLFWQKLLEFILNEENGIECSEKLFENLESLCKKYKFPNYERVLEKKDELKNSNYVFEMNKDEKLKIYNLIRQLLLDMQNNLEYHKDKEMVYRILAVLHNLPRSMHGRNILNYSCKLISCNDAIIYAQWCMDERMKEKYKKYF